MSYRVLTQAIPLFAKILAKSLRETIAPPRFIEFGIPLFVRRFPA
jgi:hypothetical protein